ncbi:39S ribosomal protein L32, mitochondrial [Schistocerca gregaria]|uniref:39S ribosomal protein L32, mitochondrial n=1 Tax=Schistocerca gregaria TaxID=7010 RepID=UPI00211E2D18|nr:39S ribosomal protein L32, mitochondrial [Schistocerca gregaria]
MAGVIFRLRTALKRIEEVFLQMFMGQNFPHGNYALAYAGNVIPTPSTSAFLLESIVGDGFLWAVPRNRRTIERRLKRKYGNPEYHLKILKPKKHLLTCNTCGNSYEARNLCPHCYEKVKLETEAMQEQIQKELGLNPVEQEVVVVYEGEKQEQSDEFWKGKRIVEMKRERPSWFSKNLLQRSTEEPTSVPGDMKPKELA